ncbi:hypothetical protein GGTG_13897 [Gaeumannomyces tritici R3-111a-1]|uniref:Uncharacterized protein n=1 Tax=Gaeumannomyces tritici (strain R3-111a-1) TaxID=644352 RepID=J3PK51_GAET3|nr:hypothetical protein GGTG_13897 [Gaeumannomyces tritici R3-111a-1]EJT68528.1 hypothetical protein GGTG_13897 [Gaeumannomyces tritici R3-111a-1]
MPPPDGEGQGRTIRGVFAEKGQLVRLAPSLCRAATNIWETEGYGNVKCG